MSRQGDEAPARPSGVAAGTLVAAVLGVWALLAGSRPLGDNSFLTHLATGRLILDEGRIPGSDPFSFTADGADWVVQSWLASVVFAALEAAGGGEAIRGAVMLLSVVLALLVWRLTSGATSVVVRFAVTAVVLVVGSETWVERPLLFGLLFLTATLFAIEDRLDPRWLVPVFWLWVNTHGSFPLGLVAIGCVAVGARLDRTPSRAAERALGWAALGTVLGGVNPLGPRLLVFPVELLSRSDILSRVVEWQAPEFLVTPQRALLFEIVLAVVALTRVPRFRHAVPFAVFLVATLLGARNVPVLALVLVPVLVAGLGDLGGIGSGTRVRLGVPVLGALLALGGLGAVVALDDAPYDLSGYPVAALAHVEAAPDGAGERLVARDYVGNLRELLDGTDAEVFVDDRVDMYPDEVLEDFFALLDGRPDSLRILDRYRADRVVWEAEQPLSGLLAASDEWRITFVDGSWVVAERRS